MHPAKCAALFVCGEIALNEASQKTVLCKFPLAEGTREEASTIFTAFEFGQPHAGDCRLLELHANTSSDGIATTKRPPQFRITFICSVISSFRFQGRMRT